MYLLMIILLTLFWDYNEINVHLCASCYIFTYWTLKVSLSGNDSYIVMSMRGVWGGHPTCRPRRTTLRVDDEVSRYDVGYLADLLVG
jgi:hypothetical protein